MSHECVDVVRVMATTDRNVGPLAVLLPHGQAAEKHPQQETSSAVSKEATARGQVTGRGRDRWRDLHDLGTARRRAGTPGHRRQLAGHARRLGSSLLAA
jgi:hypothetical protein